MIMKKIEEILAKINRAKNLGQEIDLEDMKDLHLEIAEHESISPAIAELNMLFYSFYNSNQKEEAKEKALECALLKRVHHSHNSVIKANKGKMVIILEGSPERGEFCVRLPIVTRDSNQSNSYWIKKSYLEFKS